MSATEKNTPLSTPFNNIGLSLSGGGFRAASFGLGIMSYLDHLKLPDGQSFLSKVSFISSASGGTITNTMYNMFLRQGRSFKECYSFLLEKMKGEDLLDRVLEKLNNEGEWDPVGIGKRRNLINAFAKVYDEQLFNGETFSIFSDQPGDQVSVCFNTTDFYRGLSFRFQTDSDEKSFEHIGNRYIYFDKDKDAYKKIKLADILAASSCFPAGFEPIIFPEDFVYAPSKKGIQLTPADLKGTVILEEYDSRKKVLEEPVAFMDGGITDNQGLMSLMYADERNRRNNKAFDLIITGDVTSHFMDPFKPVPEQKPEGWRNQTINSILAKISGIGKKIKTGFIISLILLAVSITAIVLDIPVSAIGYMLAGISFTTALLFGIIWGFRKKQPLLKQLFNTSAPPDLSSMIAQLNLTESFSPDIVSKLMTYLGDTKLNVMEQMVKARAASVLSMTMDVNLKHTRRLIYQLFFENEKWTDRRLYNVIFELSSFNSSNRAYRINKKLTWKATAEDKAALLNVPAQLQQIAQDAMMMGTTLWFGTEDVKNEKLKKVVACGQFTTCMNMVEYVLSIERKVEAKQLVLSEQELNKLSSVKEQLLNDWKQFKADPYFLY